MAIGEALLSAFLQVLFDRLASKEVLDFVRGHDIEKDLKKLEMKLKYVEPFLNHAESKQLTSMVVKDWVDDLKDAAYDAEDVLDEVAYEALRWTMEPESSQGSTMESLKAFSNLSNDEIGSKIKSINERFDDLAEESSMLGLEEIAAGTPCSSINYGRETSCVIGETSIYGRDDDKKMIMQLMLKAHDPGCDTKFSVISIVAMGGIGKTTLAQDVYNDKEVKQHFDLRAWVCVSDDFNAKRITKDILYDFTFEFSDSNNLNQVQDKLEKALSGKKFLIILDDVWSKEHTVWDVLQKPLISGKAGSKVIVTTRDEQVASMMGTAEYHYLKHLSDDDCWSVFVQHAFVYRDIDAMPNLVEIGKKLVKKCKGLPLAAKMLGGLLRCKPEEDEWEDILNSEIWDPETVDGVLPELRLSYDHLPSHLKRCFNFCAILPKDYEFEEMELVLFWMAEGLVQQPSKKKQMEDVGLNYFRELLSRSFFQPSSSNKVKFVINGLINDLARWVGGKTCYMLEGEKQFEISERARHLSYVASEFDGVKKFQEFDKATSLRTFLPLMTQKGFHLTNYVLDELLPTLSYLKILSLSGYCIESLPESLGEMKHLRYLDLSHTKIRSLPESTTTLYNLQTLKLKCCRHLMKLPDKMRYLINLHHLDITETMLENMPLGIGELTSLHRLSDFVAASNSGSTLGELGNLNYLRGTIRISGLNKVIRATDARDANLKGKHALAALIMEWSSKFIDSRKEGAAEDVLEMLRPHTNMEELTIKTYHGVRLPSWIGDPCFSNMVFLRLQDCVKCTSLPPLGKLPLLRDLHIESMSGVKSVGLELYGEGCQKLFPSLKTLSFENMQEWEAWSPLDINRKVEVFSQLHELSINKCPKLQGRLPAHLPSLEKLVIRKCERLVVSLSSLPNLCQLDTEECEEVVRENTIDDLSSLKSIVLSNVSKPTCLTEGFLRGLTRVEDLTIEGCSEITCLWQKEVGLLQHLPSLCHLKIKSCPNFAMLVAEKEEEEEVEQHHHGLPCRLESLELYGCHYLEKLQGLPKMLRKLTISQCDRLVSFPKTGLPPMLREIDISDCRDFESRHLTIMLCSNSTSLEYLQISGCPSLTFIARGQLPSTLKRLSIEYCENLTYLLAEEEEGCSLEKSNNSSTSLLEELYISDCESLKSLSSRGKLPITLKKLEISNCSKVESIGKSLHNNTCLEVIDIWRCESLRALPEGLHNLNHLSTISIHECPRLVSFPVGRLLPIHLSTLRLELHPLGIHNLTSLRELEIRNFPASIVSSFPQQPFPANLTSLHILDIKKCKPLFEWDLHLLTSLQDLNIGGVCPDLVFFPEEKGMILPASLTSLIIADFPNLKYLSSKGFHNLTSLEYLSIQRCPNLKSFPEKGFPPSLLRLHIRRCPLLQQLCHMDKEIANIPCIDID